MIKDDIFKPSVYKAPPENLEAARERGQILYDGSDDWETMRQACQMPPQNLIEAKGRVKAAGIYPTNLIETVWKNIDQFAEVLKEFGWKTEIYCHKKTMDAGRYKQYICIAKAGRRSKMVFMLWDKPHHLVVTTAKILSGNESSKKTLKGIVDLMEHHSGDLEVL